MEHGFPQIIIVPCCEQKRGGGHLTRCIQLTADLRAKGREIWLFLPNHDETTQIYRLLKSRSFNLEWVITNEQLTNSKEQVNLKNIGFIILDRYQTPHKELLQWKKIAPVIGIDEGGSFRDSFDFLIDILVPEKMAQPPANIFSPALLKFPANINKQKTDNVLKILITFGQEDSAGLGIKTANTLSKINTNNLDITLLKGNLNITHSSFLIPHSIRVLDVIPNLAEHLGEYDLVITHYGITAYEALYSGTPVLLAHPTPYHKKLAKAAGFLTFSKFFTQSYRNTKNININNIKEHCETLAKKLKPRENTKLSELINNMSVQTNRLCPVCGTKTPDNSVSRFNDRTYRRCSKCGVIYMDRTNPPPIEYEREYFFEQYRKQYGKTYLEDFDNIKNAGKHRLNNIINLSRRFRTSGSAQAQSEKEYLLDIGCAYGPFLSAAKEAGFMPTGIDPAQDAVNYVRQKLGIHAIHGFFPNSQLSTLNPPLYDAVTLWFVIEHFTDCASVLAAIKNILKPGGTLAFSTPSFSGISGRSNLRRFLSASPADHWTVWSPAACKKALSLAGFKVKKIVVCGHHPERFPLFGKFAKDRKNPIYFLLLAISKIFMLGDTFEVYAQLCKKNIP